MRARTTGIRAHGADLLRRVLHHTVTGIKVNGLVAGDEGRVGQLDFYHLSLLDDGMRGIVLGCVLWSIVVLPSSAWTVTPSPALTDREIAERLTRLETRLDEGLTGLRSDIATTACRDGPTAGGHAGAEPAVARRHEYPL